MGEDFYGDLSVEIRIGGEIDFAHAAFAQEAGDFEGA
jgi:hypothetical protein